MEVLRDRVTLLATDVPAGALHVTRETELLLAKSLRPELHTLTFGVSTFSLPLLVERPLSCFPSNLPGPSALPRVQSLLSSCHEDHPIAASFDRWRSGRLVAGLAAEAGFRIRPRNGPIRSARDVGFRVNNVTRKRRW